MPARGETAPPQLPIGRLDGPEMLLCSGTCSSSERKNKEGEPD